jgi:outer membrane protein
MCSLKQKNRDMKSFNKYLRYTRLGIVLLLPLLFTSEISRAQNNSILTLPEAINQVLADNQGFAAKLANLQAKEKDIEIARANFIPSLHFSTAIMPSQGTKISDYDRLGVGSGTQGLLSAGMSQMIYNEAFFANHKIQKNLYISEQEQFRGERYQLIANAGESYINLLVAEDLLIILQDNLELTKKNLDAAIYRAEVGASSQQEVLRWKTQQYSDQQNIAGQKANILQNRIALNQLRDQPDEQIETLDKLSIEEDGFVFSSSIINAALESETSAIALRDFLVELGLSNSPDIASMDAEVAAQERQLKSQKRWLIPNFSLIAGADELFLTKDDDDGNKQKNGVDFWFVGVSAKWNVFKGGSNFSKVKQLKYQSLSLQSVRKETESSQEKVIRSSVSVLIADFQKVGLSGEQAEVAALNYELVFDSYLVGEVSLLDLLDAQEQKFSADYTAIAAFYTFFLDLLNVEEAIGYFPFLATPEEVDVVIRELERKLLGG